MTSPRTSRRAQAGNAVAWLALATSIAGLLFSFLQWRSTQDQLALQQRAIEDQRGRLLVDGAYVDLYDAASSTWKFGAGNASLVNQRLPYGDFEAFSVFVVLDVYNVSHTPLTIKGAGVLLGGQNQIAETPTFCAQAGPTEALTPCALPLTLQPQTNSLLFLRISDVTDALSCNTYVNDKGLIGAVRMADNRVASGKTQTFDPYSPVCAGPVEPSAGVGSSDSPSGTSTRESPVPTPGTSPRTR